MNHPYRKIAGQAALGLLFVLSCIGMWAIEDLAANGPDRRLLKVVAMGTAFGLCLILVGALLRAVLTTEKPEEKPKGE